MRAYERKGKTWLEVRQAEMARYRPNGIAAFISDQAYLRRERQYIKWQSKPALRNFIGPLTFTGPIWDGKREFVGEIIGGRVYNSVTMLNYWCARGMCQQVVDEYVARLCLLLVKMRDHEGPRLP